MVNGWRENDRETGKFGVLTQKVWLRSAVSRCLCELMQVDSCGYVTTGVKISCFRNVHPCALSLFGKRAKVKKNEPLSNSSFSGKFQLRSNTNMHVLTREIAISG